MFQKLIHTPYLSIFFLLSFSLPTLAETCNIDGNEFTKVAVSKGFNNLQASNGGGSCLFFNPEHPDMVIAVAGNTKNLVCEIEYFTNKTLVSPWKIVSATIVGHPFEFIDDTPKQFSNSPRIKFKFNVAKADNKVIRMSMIKLAGPNCMNWKEALN